MRYFCEACRLLRADEGEPTPQGACPKCGVDIIAGFERGEEFNLTVGAFLLLSKRPGDGRNKWFCKSVQEHSYYRKTDRRQFIERVFNKLEDRYCERIVDDLSRV